MNQWQFSFFPPKLTKTTIVKDAQGIDQTKTINATAVIYVAYIIAIILIARLVAPKK